MQRLRIDHLTEYRFAAPTTLLQHRMLLRPRESHAVRIASSHLKVTPTPVIRWQRDALDNSVALATFADRADRLRIESSVVIEHYEQAPLDFLVDQHAVNHPFDYEPGDAVLLAAFVQSTWPGDRAVLDDWLSSLGLRQGSRETFALLDRLNLAIHETLRYEAREEPGVHTPAQTLASGTGSCRDFAALYMEATRALGMASRFVSGYLHVSHGAPAPASGATHAWAEVYLPGPGWKGFDPTCGRVADADHIAVAVAQQPEQVPPVAGSYLGTPGQPPALIVSVQVRPWPQ